MKKIDIKLPKGLENFEIHLDENKCEYSTKIHESQKVHVFSGPVKDYEDIELEVLYNEDKKELVFASDDGLNVYDEKGHHIGMS